MRSPSTPSRSDAARPSRQACDKPAAGRSWRDRVRGSRPWCGPCGKGASVSRAGSGSQLATCPPSVRISGLLLRPSPPYVVTGRNRHRPLVDPQLAKHKHEETPCNHGNPSRRHNRRAGAGHGCDLCRQEAVSGRAGLHRYSPSHSGQVAQTPPPQACNSFVKQSHHRWAATLAK